MSKLFRVRSKSARSTPIPKNSCQRRRQMRSQQNKINNRRRAQFLQKLDTDNLSAA